jgi:hypothetical protein
MRINALKIKEINFNRYPKADGSLIALNERKYLTIRSPGRRVLTTTIVRINLVRTEVDSILKSHEP